MIKWILLVFLCVVALLAIAILLGPRVNRTITMEKPVLPDDLDAYLKRSEAKYTDIRDGLQKGIIWADASRKLQTEYAVVYLHGFSASRGETAPLSDLLAEHLKANLFYTRLSGHGRSQEAMGQASLSDWINDGAEAIGIGERIGQKIILVGTSTGATLATWLALDKELNSNIAALVLISPNFAPRDPRAGIVLWPWGMQLARMIQGDYREFQPINALNAKYWTNRYPIEAVGTMMALVDIVDKAELSQLQVPALIIHHPDDSVIDVEKLNQKFKALGSPRKRLVAFDDTDDPGNHVLAGDAVSPGSTEAVLELIIDFLEANVK